MVELPADRAASAYNGAMRWPAALGLLLVGCYDPQPRAGSPCSETMPCPSALRCIEGFCGGAPGDDTDGAPNPTGDGTPTALDRDGDGVNDTDDNCVDIGNADQGNEDSDALGDECDPCPIEGNNTDGDGDGVGDACDPHPGAPGDTIVAFSGFHAGVPTGWQVIGQVAPMGDELSLTTVAGNHTALIPPVTAIANGTITTVMTVDAEPPDNACGGPCDAASTVTMPYDPNQDQGVFCELYSPVAGSANNRTISLWDSLAQIERGKRAFPWTLGVAYKVALTRTGNSYACAAAQTGLSPVQTAGQTGATPQQAKPAVALYGSSARVQYVLVVKSP